MKPALRIKTVPRRIEEKQHAQRHAERHKSNGDPNRFLSSDLH
jgi:hypothetical protein